MLQFDMGTGDFLSQLAELSDFGADDSSADSASGSASASDAAAKNRNRGNYRCSKVRERTRVDGMLVVDAHMTLTASVCDELQCGEPKKGHVCPLVPTNFKCPRCGLPKKTCSCSGA